MDPNANLKEQIEIATAIVTDNGTVDANDVMRLAELVLALDEWISRGGFPPATWRQR